MWRLSQAASLTYTLLGVYVRSHLNFGNSWYPFSTPHTLFRLFHRLLRCCKRINQSIIDITFNSYHRGNNLSPKTETCASKRCFSHFVSTALVAVPLSNQYFGAVTLPNKHPLPPPHSADLALQRSLDRDRV